MRDMRSWKVPWAWAVLALLCGSPGFSAEGKGISSDFGVVTLNNIPAGKAYRLTARPVRVVNGGSVPISLEFEPVVPAAEEMVAGFERIPDPSWVRFSPDRFDDVGGGKEVSAVLTLEIPDKPEYAGKKYQVSLYLHSLNDKGTAVGLKPKLCFRVADAGVKVNTDSRPEVPISVEPPEITGEAVFLAVRCQSLTVINRSSEPMKWEAGSPGGGEPGAMPERKGYESLPPDITLSCNPASLDLPGKATATVEVTAQLPADGRYSGKKFQGTLYSRVTYRGKQMNLINRVILDIPPGSGQKNGRGTSPAQKPSASKLKAMTQEKGGQAPK